MRRFTFLAAIVSAALLVTGSTASGENVPKPLAAGHNMHEPGRGAMASEGVLPVEAGESAVVQTIHLDPGDAIGWHEASDDAIFIVTGGALTNYTSCTDKTMWGAGKAYPQLKSGGTHLIKNEGNEPAEVVAIFSRVAAGEAPVTFTEAPAGCPVSGAEPYTSELARGAAFSTGSFDLEAGKSVVVEHFSFAPGFTTTWHRHPGQQLIIQTKGTVTNYFGCEEKETWLPGYAYLHLNSEHHNAHAQMTRNESNEQTELVALFFNIPDQPPHRPGATPLTPFNPPPSDCPTMLF